MNYTIVKTVSMPAFRSLHVEVGIHSSWIEQQLTSSSLPHLEQLSVLFCCPAGTNTIRELLAAHGPKLKLLRLEMSKRIDCMGHADLGISSFLVNCPPTVDLIVDFYWFRRFNDLGADNPVRRLGILMMRTISDEYGYTLIDRLAAFRDAASLPKRLHTIRILDFSSQNLRKSGEDVFSDFFASWTTEWRGRGIKVEDMNGQEFTSDMST